MFKNFHGRHKKVAFQKTNIAEFNSRYQFMSPLATYHTHHYQGPFNRIPLLPNTHYDISIPGYSWLMPKCTLLNCTNMKSYHSHYFYHIRDNDTHSPLFSVIMLYKWLPTYPLHICWTISSLFISQQTFTPIHFSCSDYENTYTSSGHLTPPQVLNLIQLSWLL